MKHKIMILPKSMLSNRSVADSDLILAKRKLEKQLEELGYNSKIYSVQILKGNVCRCTFSPMEVKPC